MKTYQLILSSALTCAVGLQANAVKKKPNVIYIMADDLGYGDLSCYGQTHFPTPNIDRLAKDGIKFNRHYAGSTVSAPSRTSLMTGKHTGHCYIRGNNDIKASDGRFYDTPLKADELTIGELFKSAGYSTACIGKWGMGGPNTEGDPNAQGFDYFYGYLGQLNAHSYYPDVLHENGKEVVLDRKVYSHDLLEDKALDFITAKKDSSFFLYLSVTIPHAELKLPEAMMQQFVGKYLEKPYKGYDGNTVGGYSSQSAPHAAFAAMVYRLDETVGKIRERLEALGIDKNTLVIFTSDNGPHAEGGADPNFFNSNGIYRGIKRDLYEGGIRVPLIAYWPKHIKAGQETNYMSAFWDFLPTCCSLIGVDVPKNLDGKSYLPVLKGKNWDKQERVMYWEFHEGGGKQAIMEGNWKLIRLQAKTKAKTYYELYDLSKDPSEQKNLYAEYPEKAKALMTLMDSEHTESSLFRF